MPKPESRRFLRLIVASPGDVQQERKVLCDVVDNLNRSISPPLGLHVQLLRWETDAYPGFHVDGPQGLIDEVLGIRNCDIMVGIFWKRFGTPTKDAESGTEHELRTAYKEWRRSRGRRPHVMVYFKKEPYTPKNASEKKQWGKVCKFKKQFGRKGLFWEYKEIHEFERLTWKHLTQVLAKNAGALGGSPYTLIKSPEKLFSANARIIKEAQDMLYTTGSRSRDKKHLECIEAKLKALPKLVHYRVLFGPPHHPILKRHLAKLLKIRSPADRTHGFQTIHVGLFEDTKRQFEAFIVGNEKEALVLLPSFSGLSEYNSAIIFTNPEEVEGLKRFVKELYAASKKIETPAKVESLKVLRAEAKR